MTNGIFILLGTNLGDKKQNLREAKTQIETAIGDIVSQSSIYATAPWGKEDQPTFYNQVIQISTELQPLDLLNALLAIENSLGRTRVEKWGERLIDLDILYYNDQVLDEDSLKVPHPGIPERRFTLVPLVELAAEFQHPILKEDNSLILRKCVDKLTVKKVLG